MPRGPQLQLLLLDALAILAGFWLAHLLRFESGLIAAPLGVIPLADWMLLGLASLPLWLLILSLHGLYYARLKQDFGSELASLTHSVAEGLVATILTTFALRELPDSRLALLLAALLGWLLLVMLRTLRRRMQGSSARAAVIGNSELARYLVRQLEAGNSRFQLTGRYDRPAELPENGFDWLFCDADLADELWQRLGDAVPQVSVSLLPKASTQGVLSVANVLGMTVLNVKNGTDIEQMRRIKRVVDVLFGSLLLILTLPLWMICILGITLTMPGPLFFSHERLGLFGRRFRAIKFRSMLANAAEIKVDLTGFDDKYKLQNDPRITKWGSIMRKTSLDELPQLINIIRGDCSLVGPRAIVERELAKYGEWGMLLLTVPPGLTGLWQVSGRSDTSYQQRIDFDLHYINNWSLGLDLLIILRTIPAVLSRKGAY
jgi:exopolysaccharide biosynthesis polyprenyl glycosylphosphotransferase